MKIQCPDCYGKGFFLIDEPTYERVTREMAIDAGHSEYEGEKVQSEIEQIKIMCKRCKGTSWIEDKKK